MSPFDNIPLWGQLLVVGPLYLAVLFVCACPLLIFPYFIYLSWREREWLLLAMLLFLEWLFLAVAVGISKGWFA